MRSLTLVLGVLGLAGCAGGTVVYEKPGASVAQRDQDKIECAKLSTGSDDRKVGPGLGIDHPSVRECMRERGYAPRASK